MSIQGCAHGSRVIRFGRPRASVRTHLARARVPCRIDQTRVASAAGSTRVISMLHVMARDFEALADQLHLRAHTCVLQRKSIEGCTLGSTVTRVSRPRTYIVRAHVPCRIDQTRAAPTGRELQRFGRATADVSIHMCVAECINSGLHPRVKGYNGVADQLLQ